MDKLQVVYYVVFSKQDQGIKITEVFSAKYFLNITFQIF